MHRALSYETAIDGFGVDGAGFAEDKIYEEGHSDYRFDESGAGPEAGETDRAATPGEWELNQELRLVNAYFKEVGTESLMTAREEIEVAAKIKECAGKRLLIDKAILAIAGGKRGADREGFIEDLKARSREDLHLPGFADVERERLMRLLPLHEAYVKTEGRLRNRFVKANLRLVASLAKKYMGRGIPFLDLIQEGNLGLMKAVGRYDHTRGYRFSTYACWWINQSMIRGIFNQTRTVKIPAYVLEKAGKVWSERARFMELRGREPHPSEIAARVDMSEENVKQVLDSGKGANTVRLDSPVWNGNNATYMDYIADEESVPVDSLIAEVSIPTRVEHALHMLDQREREILKMRFGIGYQGTFTLDEIGKKFDLTRERIRQIEKRALSAIRNSSSAPALKSLIEPN